MRILIDQRTDDILIDENMIEKVIVTALKKARYGIDYEISISFVDEEEIKSLNTEYRNKASVTDVLSFQLYEKEDIPDFGMLGDIVVCVKRAKEQAEEFGHSLDREIYYLIVHSVLHLLGYDHELEEEKVEMRMLEKEIMRELGIFKG